MNYFLNRCENLQKKLAEKEEEVSECRKKCEEAKTICDTYALNTKRLKKQLTLVSWVSVFNVIVDFFLSSTL